jgi:UDP-glucose 4-epimerase
VRILVTGGAGFIGSHVVDRFVALGHEVAVLDNLSTGRRDFVNPRAHFELADLTDAPAVERLVAAWRPEIVDHHAAQIDVRRSVADPLFDATGYAS